MKTDSEETAPPTKSWLVVGFDNELPIVAEKLSRLGEARVLRSEDKLHAADLIKSEHFNVVIINEDNWKEARELVVLSSDSGAGAVIVQGPDLGGLGHLSALLAGADLYAPLGENEWIFDPNLPSSERPSRALARVLTDALKGYEGDLGPKILDHIRDLAVGASNELDVQGAIQKAAAQVNEALSDKITGLIYPRIQHLLKATSVKLNAPKNSETDLPLAVDPAEYLYWNSRFPEHPTVLLNEPHEVEVGTVYPFETAVEPSTEPGDLGTAIPANDLIGKIVTFILKASNGQFRDVTKNDEWHAMISSDNIPCSASGTGPFRVEYRALTPGKAEIDAVLLVDNGSISEQRIDMRVAGTENSLQVGIRAHGISKRLPSHSFAQPPGADLFLWLMPDSAVLSTRTDQIKNPYWVGSDLRTTAEVASLKAYKELAALSQRFSPGQGLTLMGGDGESVLLRLAVIGSTLYRTLFLKSGHSEAPAMWKDVARRLRESGDAANPCQLQIIARDIPVPWGILYDGEPPGLNDSPQSVQPDRFWGIRFDIYRHANSPSELGPYRGDRCLVKPIVGREVPRGELQLEFFENFAGTLSGSLEFREPALTPEDLLSWAADGDDNDLLYFYCHAVPDERALVFGPTERDESRVSLEELGNKWGRTRSRNPVVVLNGCSSGQADAINGRPFVEFFMEKWGAQAFIGTDWPIQAALADEIGKLLLEDICEERMSLRQALRAVIKAGMEKGNYFPLMYAVYGPSNVRFGA
ncbi:CHAT domain-containing protein [Arthrobacter sp. NicSoilB11]|uniref:CHAT domain-containing protein n=1 Tax=Arthrobacter sp. NicSoilB11 TaxID=2830999 RepID=UPI001CC678E4|nr:CHAT domain-containing protein [Arthrobacter sp. NicSoilB11]BCW75438.1 hypothetical protein NicSoilB11_17630 [Arthrobacter sp. NicSoilB11]